MELIGLTLSLSLYERPVVSQSHKDYRMKCRSFVEACQLGIPGRNIASETPSTEGDWGANRLRVPLSLGKWIKHLKVAFNG